MARRQVSIFINDRQVENTLKGIRDEKRKVNRELNRMTIGSDEYIRKAKEMERLNGIINDHYKRLGRTSSTYQKLSASVVKFAGAAAAAFTAEAIVRYGTELFKLGAEMEVLTQKAETVFAQALPQVTAAAEANAAAMGLTVSQYTDAAAAIGDLLVPMGFTREEAANVSVELTNLSGALAEWTGGQVEAQEVTDILGKAILGERESLKQLGISIKESEVTARLAAKGLSNLTGASLEQAKAAATLELITEKSTDAQTAFADGSGSLLRRQAELRAQFENIREQLATALVPVFTRLLEVAQPLVARFADFITRMTAGSQASQKYSKTLQVLGTAFGNLGKFVRLILGRFRALGNFLLDNFGPVIEFIVVQMARVGNVAADLYNGVAEFLNLDFSFQKINTDDVKAAFDEIRKAREESGVDKPIDIKPAPTPSGGVLNLGGGEDGGNDDPDVKKQTEKVVNETEKALKRLEEITAKYRDRARLARMEEQERELEEIRQRYAEQIELAKELEAQGIEEATAQRKELERLRDEELLQAQLERIDEQEQLLTEKAIEDMQQRYQAEQAARQELQEFSQEALLSEREQDLLELEEYFAELTALAEQFGIDTNDITQAYREKRKQINERYNQEETDAEVKAQQDRANAVATGMSQIASVTQNLAAAATQAGLENTAVGRSLALTTILAKGGEAVAKAIASAAGQPFPANLVAIGTSIAAVTGAISQARKIFDESPAVGQRFTGGYYDVLGATDRKKHRAKYIGEQDTGLLPSGKVLLANERGREYLVSNQDLQRPAVLKRVQEIESMRTGKGVDQRFDGGFTDAAGNPLPQSGTTATGTDQTDSRATQLAAMTPELLRAIFSELQAINAKMDRVGTLDDDTLVNANARLNKLNKLSGGIL